jgi:hypothetical protein
VVAVLPEHDQCGAEAELGVVDRAVVAAVDRLLLEADAVGLGAVTRIVEEAWAGSAPTARTRDGVVGCTR